MLQAFTLLFNANLKSELPTVRITSILRRLLVRALDQSWFHFLYNKKAAQGSRGALSTRSTSLVSVQIAEPSRQVSILAEAATIENHPTPQYSFWQSAEQPCKLHPHCDIVPCLIRRTDSSQRGDYSDDTHTAYVATRDCRGPTGRIKVRTCLCSRFEICGDCGKKQSAPVGLVVRVDGSRLTPGFKASCGRNR
jgi:hypothetical protein